MKHVVMFSGGAGSWAAAAVLEPTLDVDEELTLLFADTLMEDEDLYRFVREAADDVGGELVTVTEGRDPWQVFKDKRFLGNSRIDPCSYYLKRRLLRQWLEQHCDPADTVVYLGIDWTEEHRFTKAIKYWAPWTVRAPLVEHTEMTKDVVWAWLADAGIARPRLYDLGFAHNNCGGFCVKAGIGHFKHLLEVLPERYAYHEAKENELREYLGKDVAILTDRRGGGRRPLTMTELRLREEPLDLDEQYDIGGCNCVNPDEAVDQEIAALHLYRVVQRRRTA